jgi:hypothetical protein
MTATPIDLPTLDKGHALGLVDPDLLREACPIGGAWVVAEDDVRMRCDAQRTCA